MTYTDRRGNPWRFKVPTVYQSLLLARTLRAARSVGTRERLTLGYLAEAEENDAFLDEIETTMLSALSKRYPAQVQAPPQPLPPDPAATTEIEEREPYYWERDNF